MRPNLPSDVKKMTGESIGRELPTPIRTGKTHRALRHETLRWKKQLQGAGDGPSAANQAIAGREWAAKAVGGRADAG